MARGPGFWQRSAATAAARSRGHYLWVICALLFLAATINYIDRQVVGILKPTLVDEFAWTDERIYAAELAGVARTSSFEQVT